MAKELLVARACGLNNFNNNSNFNANNYNVNNNNGLRGIAQQTETFPKMHRDLWKELCSYDNLFLGYKKARKHKTTKDYVIKFEKSLKDNLLLLRSELLLHSYNPKPLINFIIRDPKTRKISKSDFRDRVVHHALCNIIEPIFERSFIYDSYANRRGKGALKAIERLDYFKRRVSKNNTHSCYILKADIRKYFDTVDHNILLTVIRRMIKDKRIIWLIQKILNNSTSTEKKKGCENHRFSGLSSQARKGMPLGNLTSQFFANVYLNELDHFVKHKLKVRYYIRYVDDFVILHSDKNVLIRYKYGIDKFLQQKLKIELHPDKSRIIFLGQQLCFLGLRIFYFHKLLKKSNLRKMRLKCKLLKQQFDSSRVDYDKVYDFFEGWLAYAKNADTYTLRIKAARDLENAFPGEISVKEISRYAAESNQ